MALEAWDRRLGVGVIGEDVQRKMVDDLLRDDRWTCCKLGCFPVTFVHGHERDGVRHRSHFRWPEGRADRPCSSPDTDEHRLAVQAVADLCRRGSVSVVVGGSAFVVPIRGADVLVEAYHGDRARADVLLVLAAPDPVLGWCIAVEVQLRSIGAELMRRTREHWRLGRSVAWLGRDDVQQLADADVPRLVVSHPVVMAPGDARDTMVKVARQLDETQAMAASHAANVRAAMDDLATRIQEARNVAAWLSAQGNAVIEGFTARVHHLAKTMGIR